MRSSRTSRFAATAVFILITVVVVGGMTWATASSFALAKKNAAEEHEQRLHRAVWQMDSYMGGIMNSEAAREYTDYVAFHWRRPFAVVSERRAEMDAVVVLQSPLAILGPPHDWIDVYFQISTDGTLTSPQIGGETGVWPFENSQALESADRRTLQTWEWLRTALPGVDLRHRVAQVCRTAHRPSDAGSGADEPPDAKEAQRDSTAATSTWAQESTEYQQRKRSHQDFQVSYLPPAACETPDVADRNVRNVAGPDSGDFGDEVVQLVGDVEISLDPFVNFWLDPGPDEERKLLFVRECHADAAVFYQGFVGDWSRLEPVLLEQIANLFPDADLEAVSDEMEPDPEATKTLMINLPVRLRAPDIPGGASAAAWRANRGTLITTWAAAAAVLVVAGWGLRNLVALTERRMQFAYTVTHELRTPLTTFRLYSDMLSAGLVPDSSKQEYLETLDRESLRLSNLVEGVLEYARLESHRVKLNPINTDGASLLRVISETLEKQCEANRVEARTQNGVPDGRRWRTDVDVVNRIAGVLVDNACRHARRSDNGAVLVRLAGEDGGVHLDVIDSGPGIDRADARSIFKPFRRGRSADAAAQGGIGLGLALARSWADLLGGRLDLVARHHPQYGGAHFRLTIPAQET